ncbi:MAG TPA: LLM class flavin-dependent oxidoreductase [Nitrososphaerales archaeon]|nr:LLM class flavin-dependent oxidoreductase [Nitrososphaerales archaeon]
MASLKDFGIMLEPQLGMTMETLVEAAKAAERLGFGYVFRSDHLLPTDDRRGIDSPECWTSLGAVAGATSSIRFGPMVSPIGFHNPAVLAKMALTIHSYSNGRLLMGIGTGWYESEYRAHGLDFPPFGVRFRQFSEASKIIHTMLRDERVDFDGEYFTAHTDCFPRPSGRVHVIIGGRSARVIRLAALYADEWNFFTKGEDDLTRGKALLEEARNDRKVEVTEAGPYMVGRTQSELEKNAQGVVSEQSMAITAKEFLDQVRRRGSPCGLTGDFVAQLGKRFDSGLGRFYFQFLTPKDTSQMESLADTLRQGF